MVIKMRRPRYNDFEQIGLVVVQGTIFNVDLRVRLFLRCNRLAIAFDDRSRALEGLDDGSHSLLEYGCSQFAVQGEAVHIGRKNR